MIPFMPCPVRRSLSRAIFDIDRIAHCLAKTGCSGTTALFCANRWQNSLRETTPIDRGIGDDNGHGVGVEISPSQMIGAGLGCRVWAIRRIAGGLAKTRFVSAERAIYFVGRDMNESELLLSLFGEPLPICACAFQQI